MRRTVVRAGVLTTVTGFALAMGVLPASAHVSLQPSTAAAGSYTTLVFKVPTESDTASTTGIDVQLPPASPFESVSVQPKAGWTYKVTKAAGASGAAAVPAPAPAGGHHAADQVVTRVTWTVAPGSPGIRPGEFDTFTISAGPLPERAGPLAFKTLQNYSDGKVVRWVDEAAPGAAEPDNPAPTLTVTAASAATSSGAAGQQGAGDGAPAGVAAAPATAEVKDSDGTARALGIIGIIVGALGLAVGAFGLIRARRAA